MKPKLTPDEQAAYLELAAAARKLQDAQRRAKARRTGSSCKNAPSPVCRLPVAIEGAAQ